MPAAMALGRAHVRSARVSKRNKVEKYSGPPLTLAQMRKKRALSTIELADASGVNVSTIQRIESDHTPRWKTIRNLARALNCDPEDINWPGNVFGLDDEG